MKKVAVTYFVLFALIFAGGIYYGSRDMSDRPQETSNYSVFIEPFDKSHSFTQKEIEDKQRSLDSLSYKVMVQNGTETPFRNEYWNNHAEGIYVDKVTGTPLFSSEHKFDSATGWPSFWRALDDSNITLVEDNTLGMTRTEVRSSGGHLGHLFEDGPKEHGGLRYCINSAALIFVPKEDMEKYGYGDFL